eukprot:3216053-Pyramimonas_sp.AAC.1
MRQWTRASVPAGAPTPNCRAAKHRAWMVSRCAWIKLLGDSPAPQLPHSDGAWGGAPLLAKERQTARQYP